ncbi:MAG: aspartyl/asparaginyl beta-hydroxylase domain-containing protein [Chitinophagaceae bacterium]|nr:aspartyl/asparaginyl beta-hydroxylase domain-containing protein [Chitinophagaceae bacterium]MCB9044670.1 aspartyl/asparaginyl beta-hydroxylase domain-containing protein [Chitinophagales bacterium]
MKTLIKYAKLPFHFDTTSMLQDVLALAEAWLPHYNQNDYSGDWKAIPLRSINGSITNASAIQVNASSFRDTELMQLCPHIRHAIDMFQCEKTSVRVLNLRPGAIINEHIDQGLCYEEGEIRIHVPLITNEKVEFYIEEEPVYPEVGECWYMNFNLKHRLANYGVTDRIHLVVDCVVNDWIHKLFTTCDEETMKRISVPEQFSKDEKLMMINELKNMGTDAALQLAKEMEQNMDVE